MSIFGRSLIHRRLEGPAVAALGSVAGGLAAKALGADKGKGPTNGGGIPGLTSSKGQGKDGTGPGYVTQVDPSTAISYFKQAADAQAKGYDLGLSYYKPALDQAAQEIKTGYLQANQTLQPLSWSSNQALNEQMRMLGMDPMPATQGYADTLRNGYGAVKDRLPSEVGTVVNTIGDMIDHANTLKTKEERSMAIANINSYISQAPGPIRQGLQNKLNAIKAPTMVAGAPWFEQGPPSNIAAEPAIGAGLWKTPLYINGAEYGSPGHTADDYLGPQPEGTFYYDGERIGQVYDKLLSDYNAARAPILAQMKELDSYSTELSNFASSFDNHYTPEYDKGYTGDQIVARVTTLPGYQFNLDQGTKAIERQGAAAGMLGSGNTLTGLTNYGQGLAQQYYNQYMGYLSGVVQEGAPATAQISANQAAQGTALATLAENWGLAQMDNERRKADFLAKTLQDSGILFNQTAMFNAGEQNKSILMAQQQAGQNAQQAIQSGPAYQQAATNYGQLQLAQQQFGWGQQQSQQYAQGFSGGKGGGGVPSYSTYGMSFPSYTGADGHGGWI